MSRFASASQNITVRLGLIFSLMLLAQWGFAHAGHDHHHWLSDAIHLFSILAILSVVFVLARALERHMKRKRSQR